MTISLNGGLVRQRSAPGDGGGEYGAARQLWSSIPGELAERMAPLSGVMVRDAVREIRRAVPAYAQPLEGKFREVLVGAVEMAIVKCFDTIADPDAPQADWQAVLRYSGRMEYLEGRTMDSLQTAVRVGARVVWRHLSEHGRAMGVSTDTLFVVADAIFAWVDELCRVAVEGYSEARANASGALERRRRQLLKLVLAEQPPSPRSLADLAGTTDWPLPDQVAVVALEYREDQHQLPSVALGRDVLVDLESSTPCLVVANPSGRLRPELRGRRAAVGPTVPLAQARQSLACARRALAFVRRGLLPAAPVTWCDDHLATLALLSDEFLVDQLSRRALAAFAGLTVKQRERLETTLLAWLETRGGIGEIASRLDVHPQTVRYRMHQLEELLGDRLADPDERLTLEIALRARRVLSQARDVQQPPRAGTPAKRASSQANASG
ncbi:helix-turn-helix domain-containing protein [Saccharothrix sp. S26]|uniref:PucR family transcriptional regulator n=1 Tax=Saccharothrix sp. S26 TaxID=2907215 RepID=UPI001F15DE87|nr:PucR family transcriptional regulator [Saccharothrix sp. S26]MCE6994727.1 helix-turn-helix domain-containing protein [Saccharothrix sp. S26]